MPHDNERPSRSDMTRYAGMGLEFAGAVIGFCLVGWWIDHHWQIEGHWGVVICGMLGIVGGMYNLIREALLASREAARPASSSTPKAGKDSAEHGAKPPDA